MKHCLEEETSFIEKAGRLPRKPFRLPKRREGLFPFVKGKRQTFNKPLKVHSFLVLCEHRKVIRVLARTH